MLISFTATCFYCFCPLCLTIKLNIDISKMAYWLRVFEGKLTADGYASIVTVLWLKSMQVCIYDENVIIKLRFTFNDSFDRFSEGV